PGSMEVIGDEENELFYADMHFIAEQRRQANALQSQLKALPKGSPEAETKQQELAAINDKVQNYRQQFLAEHPDFLYAKMLKALEEPQVPEPPKNADGSLVDSLFAFTYYRAHFFDNFDFSDDRLLRTPIFQQKINQYMDKLTAKLPDSIAVAADHLIELSRSNDEVFRYMVVHFLNKYANSKIMGMDGVYVHLVEKYYLSGDAWWADEETLKKMEERAKAISPTLINRKAPNFWVPDANGQRQTLHEQAGEFTVLYFWDIDCGHCKKVTPKLSEAFRQYHNHDIRLMTVSINGDQAGWEKRLEEYGLTGQPNTTHTHDPLRQSQFDGWYDLRSTPRLFLLDKEKKIVAKQISVFQMQEILNRALDLPAPERDEAAEAGK
ncbi:MAG: redoxin domain-containing protein, partial [Bacteroidota bacterium]